MTGEVFRLVVKGGMNRSLSSLSFAIHRFSHYTEEIRYDASRELPHVPFILLSSA